MSRNQLILGAIVGLVVIIILIAFAVFRTPESASGPLVAPTLQVPTGAASEITDTPVSGTTQAAEATSQDTSGSSEATLAGTMTFQIVQAGSEARFVIHEVLNGQPNTVIGSTDQVAGEIAVDFDQPVNSQVGAIVVNARDLTTDNDFRNRALKNQILDTNGYEFITFTPTQIDGLPDAITGGSISFQITGDLTIKETTLPVTFDVTVDEVSPTQISGTATATVLYSDFGISIPSVRSVASVDNEVRLELDFLAEPG